MEQNKVFKLIWRINAILLLCILMYGVWWLAYNQIYRPWYYARYPKLRLNTQTYVRDEQGRIIDTIEWRYGNMQRHNNLVFLELESISKGDAHTRNYLIIDPTNLEQSVWLWPESVTSIRPEYIQRDNEIIGIFYQVEGPEETLQLYISDPDGHNMTLLLSDLTRRLGTTITGHDTILFFYVYEEQAQVIEVDLTDFTVLQHVVLPKIPD